MNGGLEPANASSRRARMARALAVDAMFSAMPADGPQSQEAARQFLSSVNPQSHVGSVHHTVPKFLLQRWARDDQVRVHSRVERKFSTRNVKDLGVTDFYTFVDLEGKLDSSFESLLGAVETPAAAIIARLLSPFTKVSKLELDEVAQLANLVAFQVVRTMRRRREIELTAEFHAKTMATGRVPDAELRRITVFPHQNQTVGASFKMAERIMPFVACRPLALIVLDRPGLLIGDEPLIVNVGPDDGEHHPDCFLTEEELRRRIAKENRKKKRLRRPVSRVVHLRPTQTRGLGVALELVLPVSPRAALWWGPLQDSPFQGDIEIDRLGRQDSERFTELVNEAIGSQALDWVISTLGDETFDHTSFPALGPLITVCGSDNAAALALNEVPVRFRPQRLRRP